MTTGPRIQIDGRGHKEIRAFRGGPSYKLHRLVAYAHGIIDAMDDPREVHHIIEERTYNAPSNLEAVEPDEHARITRANANARRARADGGREVRDL